MLGNSERLRLPRAQLVLMFICVALFSALAAFVATALAAFATPETVRWYAIFVSPGWFVSELFSWHTQRSSGWSDFWFNLPYYFGLIFALSFGLIEDGGGNAPPESILEIFRRVIYHRRTRWK
jgi:hypothetical protein